MEARIPRTFRDALYGDVDLPESIATLAATPALQRLRFVRLSNIDSLAMPGIANLSRYEHALGTAFLASQLGFVRRLPKADAMIVIAAALLHDSAIAPFGHLVEEALAYVDVSLNHETKWLHLIESPEGTDLGGIETQTFCGRVAGLKRWAQVTFGANSQHKLFEIVELVTGGGRWGKSIAGALDVDNLDNLVRIAFHMGLEVDRGLPLRVARAMTGFDATGPLFDPVVVTDVETWSELRKTVYTRLMLSPSDLCAKIMMVYAVVHAYKHGDLAPSEFVWTMTDDALMERLTASAEPRVRDTALAWMTSEQWPLAEPAWYSARTPSYSRVADFAIHISDVLDRECFAYRIADKRMRPITLRLTSGESVVKGSPSDQWLLGVASRAQRPFSQADNRRIVATAEEFFGASRVMDGSGDGRTPMPLLENA